MEMLGITASIVGLIQLSGKVASLGYGYIGAVKRASADVQDLVDELISLSKVLIALRQFADDNPQSEALATLSGPLRGCTLELEKLERKLKPVDSTWRRMLGSLKWPLKEAEMGQVIGRLERLKSLFVIALSTDHISLSRGIEEKVDLHWRQSQIEDEAHKDNRMGVKRMEVLDWLYPRSSAIDAKHSEISSRRQKNTGQWLLKSPSFEEWADGRLGSKILWGYGIPGAGKTFLSSLVVDNFQNKAREANYGVANIYFDYKEKGQQKPLQVLSSLVRQLASQTPHLPSNIEQLYDKLASEGKSPTIEDLYAALLLVFKSFSRVFLVFDALDECDQEKQRKVLLPLFHRMGEEGGASLFVTSRQYPEDIQESFRDTTKIGILAKDEDIRSYIQQQILENPRARRLVLQAGCEGEIVSGLVDCAQGMFLLARFHMEYLCQQPTAKHILRALKDIKNSTTKERPLYPTYDRVIETIHQQPRNCADLAIKVLSWLVKAKRTLTAAEIRTAVSVEVAAERYELDELDLPDSTTLVDICGGLVMIEENSDTLRLAHFTVQEYLLQKSIIPSDTNLELAKTCITYLSFRVFAEGACKSTAALDTRLDLYPFFEYAATYSSDHLENCSENLSKDVVLNFLRLPSNLCSWVQVDAYMKGHKFLEDSALIEFASEQVPLIVASMIGNSLVVKQLLDEGADISAQSKDGMTALSWAVMRGHGAVMRVLLEKGADISTPNLEGETALHKASWKGKEENVKLLLEHGAVASVLDNQHQTALYFAVDQGHEAVARLLIEKGADVSVLDYFGRTALYYASQRGNEAVVRLLIEKGADVLTQDHWRRTALHTAAYCGHEEIVRLLLEKGADPLVQDKYGRTALQHSAYYGYEGIVQILLEKGANILAQDRYGRTALHNAALNGHETVVRLLLGKGASVLAQNSLGETALRLAALRGKVDVVRLLLEGGADVLTQDAAGQAMLHDVESVGVTRLLLEKGAGALILDESRREALHDAVSGGNEAAVQLLLKSDAVESGTKLLPLLPDTLSNTNEER